MNSLFMEFDHFPRTSPDAFAAIGASLFNNGDLRFLQFDRIFRTDSDTAAAEIAFSGNDVDH